MVDIKSTQQLVDLLAANRDRLVVLDTYARWCGSCKALYPKLVKLCKENPDIVLAKVDYDANKPMCKAMGIKALPLFRFYRGTEGMVQEFTCSPTRFQRIRDALALHGPARCSLGTPPPLQEFPGLVPHVEEEEKEERQQTQPAMAVRADGEEQQQAQPAVAMRADGENNVVRVPPSLASPPASPSPAKQEGEAALAGSS